MLSIHYPIRQRLQLSLIIFVCLAYSLPTVAQASEESYVVQPGDTLSEIAQAHGTNVTTLRRLNNLGNIDFVWVGQRLQMPIIIEDVTIDSEERPETESAGVATAEREELVSVKPVGEAVDEQAEEGSIVEEELTAEPPTDESADAIQATVPRDIPVDVTTDIYLVETRDTLSTIAVKHRTTLAHLVEFNQISLAQRLNVGQALVVPVSGRAVSPLVFNEPFLHTVTQGENLSMIAGRYNVSVAELVEANALSSANVVVLGQQILIPNGQTDASYAVLPTTTEKWIDVDLSKQELVAYQGRKPVKKFIISSGTAATPTVTGTFRIWAKTPIQDMYGGNRAAGSSYYMEDVQWVQYFYNDYGFHAADWHNNFGEPMSHGCVHLRTDEAKWLFDWASPAMSPTDGWLISDQETPGTLVVVRE